MLKVPSLDHFIRVEGLIRSVSVSIEVDSVVRFLLKGVRKKFKIGIVTIDSPYLFSISRVSILLCLSKSSNTFS